VRRRLLRPALDDLLDSLLPTACAGCNTRAHGLCARCRATLRRAPDVPPPPGIDWWVAAFAYEGAARDAIARAKYRHQRAVLSWLAGCIADAIVAAADVDVVTWVPASSQRSHDNGVDHGEVLARRVANRRDLPVRRLLVREGQRAQTGRPAHERRAGPSLKAAVSAVPRRILVVDDVATTGATATASARVLRRAGARTVAFATAARTPRRA
jgi:predicted amidophosphoribosyltransferase